MRAGDLLVQRFEVESLAGTGGMGKVFRARDRLTGERVAVKVLHALQHADRFAREARIIAELAHPRIVRHVAHGTTIDGAAWLAMEWLEGEDLSSRLQHAPLTIRETIDLARGAAEGLAAAHAVGVVHRDVKPNNLFLLDGDAGRVKVVDFGIARITGTSVLTATGAMLGTPGYVAPEQARGEEDVDASADVFSLGCVLFKCLTGQAAFFGDDMLAVLAKLVLEEPPRVRDLVEGVPDALDALVGRMLAKDKAARPRDGRAVLEALEGIDLSSIQAPNARKSDAPALTTGEERIVSVLIAAPSETTETDGAIRADEERTSQVRDAATRHGGELHVLRDATVFTFVGAATMRAARCAVELARGDLRVALATGRARVQRGSARSGPEGSGPVGEAIDRAVALSREAPLGRVMIDDVTAELLTGRFAITESAGRFELAGERADEPTPVRTLLGRRTAYVGRDRELAMLELFWSDCVREGRGRPVLVTAAAGMGKTRLAYEFVARLRARPERAAIWIGRGDPIAAGSPLRMLSQAIKSAASIQDGEPLDARQRKLGAVVARHAAPSDAGRIAEFLGEMTGTPFPDEGSAQLRAARRDAKLMADQMRAAWEDFVIAASSSQPVLIVLEDLHWGDAPTVSFVDGALREVSERPCMVLALARPDVHDLFPGIWRERDVHETRIEPLSRKAGERLVRDALGDRADAESVSRVVERAGGNAFFLEELIRAEAQGRDGALPETVLGLVEARLAELDLESRRIMRAASIFGATFWVGAVAALVGGAKRRDEVADRLDILAERELLHARRGTRFPGEAEFAFRHAIVRDAAYAMLTPEDRVLGHRLAGDWLARTGSNDALVIAEHFEQGGERERAASAFLEAARQAQDADDLDGAEKCADRGVACGATGELLGRLRYVQASVQNWGRAPLADIEGRAHEAMALLPVGSPDWFAAGGTSASVAARLGHVEQIRELADALLAAPYEPPGAQARAVAMGRLGQMLFKLGDDVRAERVLAVMNEPGVGETALAFGYVARAAGATRSGDPAGDLAAVERAHALFELAGNRRLACHVLSHMGFALVQLGQSGRAEATLRAALVTADRLGLRDVATGICNNLGLALAYDGRLDEARETEQQALEAFVRYGSVWGEGNARIYLAWMVLEAGDATEACAEARRALAVLERWPPLRPYALAVHARAALAMGDPDTALSAALEAMAAIDRAEEGHPTIRLAHAEALHAAGDVSAARAAVASARDHLLDRAARISDPSLRASFLERVPDAARTLALARAWLVSPRSSA